MGVRSFLKSQPTEEAPLLLLLVQLVGACADELNQNKGQKRAPVGRLELKTTADCRPRHSVSSFHTLSEATVLMRVWLGGLLFVRPSGKNGA